jgi:hypothetical protein
MRVGEAREIARAWVLRETSGLPGFFGAYVAGSANWLPDDANLPATSDLDVNLVLDGTGETVGRRKLREQGVLLEVSTIPLDLLRTPEQVLADFALAGGFRVPSVIADPTGHLTTLQATVSAQFADPTWVRQRCQHAEDRALRYLNGLRESHPLNSWTIGWAFGASVPTLILLTAGLRNPTVRRRYVAVRELLAEHGRLNLYERLLDVYGCARFSRELVKGHLDALAETYDATVPVMTSDFPFAADISPRSRHIAIDGSRDLIQQGLHREVVFWLLVTFGRCQEALSAVAPHLLPQCEPRLRALLADLGIRSFEDIRRRADAVRALLPDIRQAAEGIIAASTAPSA